MSRLLRSGQSENCALGNHFCEVTECECWCHTISPRSFDELFPDPKPAIKKDLPRFIVIDGGKNK